MSYNRFMLIYNFNIAYLFKVNIFTFKGIERACRKEISKGDYFNIIEQTIEKLNEGNKIRTGHCDIICNVSNSKWYRGIGNYPIKRILISDRENFKQNINLLNYQDYLNSKEWSSKRLEAIKNAGGRCQICNSNKFINVHHRTYGRLGEEHQNDLTVLCRECHEIFHKNSKIKR